MQDGLDAIAEVVAGWGVAFLLGLHESVRNLSALVRSGVVCLGASARGNVEVSAGLLFTRTISSVVMVAAGATSARASSAASLFATWGVISSAAVPCPPIVVVVGAAAAALTVGG